MLLATQSFNFSVNEKDMQLALRIVKSKLKSFYAFISSYGELIYLQLHTYELFLCFPP